MSESDKVEDTDELESLDEGFEPTRIVDQTSKRIGRYELVWELGTGGMAAVYLARARGPAGFHKWFAIKRIHPHLAKDQRFVDMFLDEARIAAAIHHPNVAQVFDLGEEHGEHFIAMEYLHGEHLGALSVRAVREWGRVPYELAARIVSAAADGLHHAHEARGSDGESFGLVHRDVSPQNVFVTYEGTVKLTDFGIAKAENRITHTKTGGMKGKCAYMAPEQALGQTVDRRTDIFALGIVLWEITTGRRLFKAATDAQTLMRITSGKVRSPSALETSYPPELERIVMRALAQRPDQRYASAAAMARDLDRYIAATGRPAGRAEVRSAMTALFVDRIRKKEDLLRSEPGTVTDFNLAAVGEVGPADTGSLPQDQSQSEVVFKRRRAEPRRRETPKRRGRIAAGAALVGVALLGAALFFGLGESTAVVRIDTSPSGAAVYLDGEEADGTSPLLLEDVPEGRHALRIVLEGFAPMETTFDAEDGRVDLDYRLRPAEPDLVVSEAEAEEMMNDAIVAQEEASEPIVVEEEVSEHVAAEQLPSPTPAMPTSMMTTPAMMRGPPTPVEPAYLNVITRPWATVTINGQPAGNTPLMRRTVRPGSIVVRLRAEGTGPVRTLRLRARPGQTLSESIDLR